MRCWLLEVSIWILICLCEWRPASLFPRILRTSTSKYCRRPSFTNLVHFGSLYFPSLRPFTPLMYSPTTLGMEASPDSRRTPLDPEGLCNAVIISEPNSRFLETWRASYETFNEGVWADHSVVMPWVSHRIARQYTRHWGHLFRATPAC